MSTNTSGIGRTEAIATTTPPQQTVPSDPAVSALSSQVVQLTAMVSKMRSRMDGPGDSLVFGRLPPVPPFSFPSSTIPSSALPVFTFTPTATAGISTQPLSLPFFPTGFAQTLGASQPITVPQFGFHDAGGLIPTTTRVPQPISQQWQFGHPEQRPSDRLPISRPSG